jgi:hypothetical protein
VSLLHRLLAVFESKWSYTNLLETVTWDWNMELKQMITRGKNARS